MDSKPLVVDLDGTLIKTDLLFESANSFIFQYPLQVFRLPGWLGSGKSALKACLANVSNIDPALLPYNEKLIGWLREQKAQGRRLVLATASHRTLADIVAAYLGLFDEVLATEGDSNLKSYQKRDRMLARYGERGFDYVGNDAGDISVWQSADRAYVVSGSAKLIARVRENGNLEQVFSDERERLFYALMRVARLQQWMKNLLIFVPLLAAHRYSDDASLVQVLLAFIVFGLTSSSVYVLNDLIDVADDRNHPAKKSRPLAAGDLSLLHGWLVWPVLLTVAFLLAIATLPAAFVAVLTAYFLLTLIYSLRLKQLVIVDVITLAALYTQRVIAGAVVIDAPLSFWLLTFSMFIFLSLAFIKRFSELKMVRANGRQGMLRGRGYIQEDIEIVSSMGTGAGYLAVLVLALYIQDGHTAELYQTPQIIWLACPLLLYWISRVWLIAHRGGMHDDPVVFAFKDRLSWVIGLLFFAVFALAR
jgi:4-hydroxybenzoate polyprenyltransferase/phosphoglycolate phosphatase-like HAD superfamily hydrolase